MTTDVAVEQHRKTMDHNFGCGILVLLIVGAWGVLGMLGICNAIEANTAAIEASACPCAP